MCRLRAPGSFADLMRVGIAVAALLVVMAALLVPLWRAGAFLPDWVVWSSGDESADLDGDGLPERVVLANRRFAVVGSDGACCRAPADWLISDAFVGDITRDGTLDLVAVAWKRGSFGTSKPFWIDRDDAGFSQHVYILDYAEGQLEPVWMSSAIGFEARTADLDDQGRLHLGSGEGRTTWEWQSWGLALVGEGASAGDAGAGGVEALSLLAVGDVIAHDSIIDDAALPDGGGYDFTPLFAHVEDDVSTYDLAAVVQETPFVDDPSRYGGYPRFGTPAALGDALVSAGFDIVSAATNHAYDQGEAGLAATRDAWRHHPGTRLLGLHDSPEDADALHFVEHDGIRLALFDYTYGLNGGGSDEDGLPAEREYEIDVLSDGGARLLAKVGEAEGKADLTICFLHVGDEYSTEPSREQRELCLRLVDAGADAVICSHPHVLQPAELVRTDAGNEGVVFWSLGNFVSNQVRPDTVLGGAASLTVEKGADGARIASWELLPTVCHFEPGITQVYWLRDYTDDLAARHYVNTFGDAQAITLDGLRAAARAAGCVVDDEGLRSRG